MTTYMIELHGVWFHAWRHKDIVVAKSDEDALREARQRCTAGAVYRYAGSHDRRLSLVYVAHFFKWQIR